MQWVYKQNHIFHHNGIQTTTTKTADSAICLPSHCVHRLFVHFFLVSLFCFSRSVISVAANKINYLCGRLSHYIPRYRIDLATENNKKRQLPNDTKKKWKAKLIVFTAREKPFILVQMYWQFYNSAIADFSGKQLKYVKTPPVDQQHTCMLIWLNRNAYFSFTHSLSECFFIL